MTFNIGPEVKTFKGEAHKKVHEGTRERSIRRNNTMATKKAAKKKAAKKKKR
jgi:hypothetical protein